MGWQPFLLKFNELRALGWTKGTDMMFETLPFDWVVGRVWCVVDEVVGEFSVL